MSFFNDRRRTAAHMSQLVSLQRVPLLLSGKSVLVVEDAALIAVDIETMLDELGAVRVVTAGGGETFSPTQMSGELFDLAIVDIRTEASIGGNLAGELDRLGIPVVFLTTDPEGDSVPRHAGEHAVVVKPFTYEDVCAAIARVIS